MPYDTQGTLGKAGYVSQVALETCPRYIIDISSKQQGPRLSIPRL